MNQFEPTVVGGLKFNLNDCCVIVDINHLGSFNCEFRNKLEKVKRKLK